MHRHADVYECIDMQMSCMQMSLIKHVCMPIKDMRHVHAYHTHVHAYQYQRHACLSKCMPISIKDITHVHVLSIKDITHVHAYQGHNTCACLSVLNLKDI